MLFDFFHINVNATTRKGRVKTTALGILVTLKVIFVAHSAESVLKYMFKFFDSAEFLISANRTYSLLLTACQTRTFLYTFPITICMRKFCGLLRFRLSANRTYSFFASHALAGICYHSLPFTENVTATVVFFICLCTLNRLYEPCTFNYNVRQGSVVRLVRVCHRYGIYNFKTRKNISKRRILTVKPRRILVHYKEL